MTEFEEENMTRLVMKKKDAKRRKQDEEDIALGGAGGGSRRGRSRGGLEDEFRDVLSSVGKSRSARMGDGYEELRQRGKRQNMLERSRVRDMDADDGSNVPRKKARFEDDMKKFKKRSKGRR